MWNKDGWMVEVNFVVVVVERHFRFLFQTGDRQKRNGEFFKRAVRKTRERNKEEITEKEKEGKWNVFRF